MVWHTLKFILPEWDDIVDPHYNFDTETHSQKYKYDRFENGARLWELLGDDIIDGVLISISTIGRKKYQKILKAGGARNFLRLPSKLEIIGDCGAWQYKDKEVPPYTVTEVMKYYDELKVDYGISLDHIPRFGNPEERLQITYRNAVEMYRLWRSGRYQFTLMGAVQGIEIKDYIHFLEKLYKVGYRNFAIGGLAKTKDKYIKKLIDEIVKITKQYRDIERIHFLGITRLSLLPKLKELTHYTNISFDSSTILRIAWTRDKGNYLTFDGNAYTAIRINDPTLLQLLKKYDKGEVQLNHLLPKLQEYLLKTNQQHRLPYYLATLRDMPWKKCSCNICRDIGIDVVIFKGNNRNRRRGFHNVYIFSKMLKENSLKKFKIKKENITIINNKLNTEIRKMFEDSKKILIVTNCTAEKDVDWQQVLTILRRHNMKIPTFDIELENQYRKILAPFIKPSKDMYSGSFNSIKKLYEQLRKQGKEVDLYIISARYGLISGEAPIIPYEATLKGKDRKTIRKWSEQLKIEETLQKILVNYDLIIVALPYEYAITIQETIKKLLTNSNAILILPRRIYQELNSYDIKAKIFIASSLRERIKLIAQLTKALTTPTPTLDNWLEQTPATLSHLKHHLD